MIHIAGNPINTDYVTSEYAPGSLEVKIINLMDSSRNIYDYHSVHSLKFELNMRINIISASQEMNKGQIGFRVFKKSICNEKFWTRTEEGGFLLKDNVNPYDGIEDIFKNSSLYGTECSTAIIIIYYRALQKIFPEDLFNEKFEKLHLMNWHYIDSDLDINSFENVNEYLPGDCRYFANPDVNPKTPEWQGENAIDLGDGTYFGHGLGILTENQIIAALNKRRKPEATKSALLLNSTTLPNFKYLASLYHGFLSRMQVAFYKSFRRFI